MFHFPTFPPHALCVQARVTGHDSSRVSPFGHPRITVRLPTPRGLSQAPTSFIGSWCQGIHRVPLLTWPQSFSKMLASTVQFSSYGRIHPHTRRLSPTRAAGDGSTEETIRRTSTRHTAGHRPDPEDPGQTPVPSGPNSVPRPPRPAGQLSPPRERGRTHCPPGPRQPTSRCSTLEHHLGNTRPERGPGRPNGRQMLLRKEVIQPHLPVRLPCYDFVPIASPTFDSSLPTRGLGHRLRVLPTFVT
jgi:hypothetical protein